MRVYNIKFLKPKQLFRLSSLVLLALVFVVANSSRPQGIVYAVDNNFADGITVDSTGDGIDANLADSICDDGFGNCTLRAAMQESNNEAGTQTIEFNITGTADFTNGGQDGYTTQPASGLPDITDTVIIDGYSQPGALANTAVAPNPLNGRLLIELDGGNQPFSAIRLRTGSDNSVIKGLIINRFEGNGVNLVGSNSAKLQGCYIGTNYTGTSALPNGQDDVSSPTAISIGETGTSSTDLTTTGTLVGGLNPEDRNLISGNLGGGFGIGAVSTTVQGNFVGVASDGTTDLGNSTGTGVLTGGFTIDYAQGVLIGGPLTGAKNVISGNGTGGIQPDYSTDVDIESNIIGADYTATIPVPNDKDGVEFGFGPGNTGSIKNNIIKFNIWSGISITSEGAVEIRGNTITDNTIDGVSVGLISGGNVVSENTITDNGGIGISIAGPTNLLEGNIVSGNTQNGINVNAADNTIVDNTVSTNTANGINVSASNNNINTNEVTGNSQSGINISQPNNVIDGNIASGNTQRGINVSSTDNTIVNNTASINTQSGINISASNNNITSNEVTGNTQSGIEVSASSNLIQDNVITDNTLRGVDISASLNQVEQNVISNNHGNSNLQIIGFGVNVTGTIVQANKIGTAIDGTIDTNYLQNAGILLVGSVTDTIIGGSGGSDGNTIAGNTVSGISVTEITVIGFGTSAPANSSIVGNSIFSNDQGTYFGFPLPGLGLDIFGITLNGSFAPQSIFQDGATVNDLTDSDPGPNNYLNFPVVNSTSATAGELDVSFNLDVDDSATGYRVEFFASPLSDPSGYGEGQIYLGSKDVPASIADAKASLTIPSTFTSGRYAITATTTEKDNSTDGFGNSSEFSAVLGSQTVLAAAVASPNNSAVGVPNTGFGYIDPTNQDLQKIILGTFIFAVALVLIKKRKSLIIK